jgi:hypothetical protein
MKTRDLLLPLLGLLGLASTAPLLAACGGDVTEDPIISGQPIPPSHIGPTPDSGGPECCGGGGEGVACLPCPVDAGLPVPGDAGVDVGTCEGDPGFACGYAGGGICTISVVCAGGAWMCGPTVCTTEDAGPPGCLCPAGDDGCDCQGEDAGGVEVDAGGTSSNACGPGYVEICGGDCICVPSDAGGGSTTSDTSCGCPPDDQDCGCGSASSGSGSADAGAYCPSECEMQGPYCACP